MLSKRQIAWILYDVGNSAYVLLIASVVFPVYFRNTVLKGNSIADFWWGLLVSGTLIISAILGPILGAYADSRGQRRRVFLASAGVAIGATFLLGIADSGNWVLTAAVFGVANTALSVSIAVYDSFLSIVAEGRQRTVISGIGWGAGYLGGMLCMALSFPLLRHAQENEQPGCYRQIFLIVGAFFLIFSLPAIAWLREEKVSHSNARVSALNNVFNTLRNWRSHTRIIRLLVALYFVMDAVTTLVYFTAVYSTNTLGLTVLDVLGFMLITQLIAVPATVVFGYVAAYIGNKPVFVTSILVWIVDVALLATASSRASLIVVASVTGLVIGTTQSVGRAWLADLIPRGQVSEMFGFSAIASRVSSVLGPIVFGGVAYLTGNQRVAVWSLAVFLLLGLAGAVGVPSDRTGVHS